LPLGSGSEAPGASEGRLLAVPEAFAARARPDEASARTQIDMNPGGSGPPPPNLARPLVAGAQTDLSTARDTSVAELREALAPAAKKRSSLIYGLPVIALLLGAGIVVVAVKGKGNATTTPSATALVAPPSESSLPSTTQPPPSATATATTARTAELAAVPSASPSASASASASAVRVPVRPPTTPTGVTPPKPSNTSLDRGIIQ
jgi:hypothetical protein